MTNLNPTSAKLSARDHSSVTSTFQKHRKIEPKLENIINEELLDMVSYK